MVANHSPTSRHSFHNDCTIMTAHTRWMIWAGTIAIVLSAPLLLPAALPMGVVAQAQNAAAPAAKRQHPSGTHGKKTANPPEAAATQRPKLPPRVPFTAADD